MITHSLRQTIRSIYLNAMGTFLHSGKGVHIISSHFVSQIDPNFEIYCDFLQFLTKYCTLIKVEDSVALIKSMTKVKDCLVSFTFDDGFDECHTVIAPALEEFKTNGCFFICGNYLDSKESYKENFNNNIVKTLNKQPMSWKQIKDLHVRGHLIGSHTLDHINMNTEDLSLLEFQVARNKQLIEECTSAPCEYFALPYGRLKYINDKTLTITEKYHKYIFSTANFRYYYSNNGRIINRRHLEGDWPKKHIKYFLSVNKSY